MRAMRLWMAGLVVVGLSACSSYDRPPSHPNYAAAISDLRVARVILDRESEYSVMREQYRAMESLDRAVLELKDAAVEGGQPIGRTPVLDPSLDYRGRLARAHELIVAADHELNFREDDPNARVYRDNARDHVEDARDAVEQVIRERRSAEVRE